jgi:probable rRNA maturation factor
MILNRQKGYGVNRGAVRAFVGRLRAVLRLGRRRFNLCFVGDREMRRLNVAYLGRNRATDVLSFPWRVGEGAALPRAVKGRAYSERGGAASEAEFANFLGDIVISVEAARRNARREGHSTLNEIRWLILHGVLHLLGHDHERDRGEMNSLELCLRERLGIAGQGRPGPTRARRWGSSPALNARASRGCD